jgi:hypothetical protein
MLDEFYILSKFLRMQYSEFLKIPTYVRKYLIEKIIEENKPKS